MTAPKKMTDAEYAAITRRDEWNDWPEAQHGREIVTDPALDALTEALRDWRKVYVDPADPDRWYGDSAAAILAHPAMADLARLVAIGEAVERLPRDRWWVINHSRGLAGEWRFYVRWDEGEEHYGPTLPAAIAAALGDDG